MIRNSVNQTFWGLRHALQFERYREDRLNAYLGCALISGSQRMDRSVFFQPRQVWRQFTEPGVLEGIVSLGGIWTENLGSVCAWQPAPLPIISLFIHMLDRRAQYSEIKTIETCHAIRKEITPEQQITRQWQHFRSHFQTERTSGTQLAT